MPGITRPAREAYLEQIENLEKQVRALQTQQQFVITDPSKATGDPAHGYATVVIGPLNTICGIAAFGAAAWQNDKWVQIGEDTGWIDVTSFSNSWVGSGVAYRKVASVVRLRGEFSSGTSLGTAFTLPVGFRPDQNAFYAMGAWFNDASGCNVLVDANGEVKPSTNGTYERVALDGITFTTD
jgi:hypothetical protein